MSIISFQEHNLIKYIESFVHISFQFDNFVYRDLCDE